MRINFLIIFFFYFSALFSQECGSCSKRKTFNFKLAKKESLTIDTSQVRVDGVYLLSFDLNGTKNYQYIHFYKNGRVFFSCIYCSLPTEDQLNNLNYGSYGYYTLHNGKIKVETFEAYARYFFVFYSIQGNTITTQGSCKRKWPEPEQKDYANINTTYSFYKCNLYRDSFW